MHSQTGARGHLVLLHLERQYRWLIFALVCAYRRNAKSANKSKLSVSSIDSHANLKFDTSSVETAKCVLTISGWCLSLIIEMPLVVGENLRPRCDPILYLTDTSRPTKQQLLSSAAGANGLRCMKARWTELLLWSEASTAATAICACESSRLIRCTKP